MYCAWVSEKPNGSAIRAVRAAFWSSEARMVAMISSMMSSARMRPSTMWARLLALSSRNSERRRMTSIWWAMYASSAALRLSVRGMPSTSATVLTAKLVCSGVRL